MLYLYYTNADQYNDPQDRQDRSVGGFVSSSLVPNGQLSNIFSDLDLLTVQSNVIETKAVALQNKSVQLVTDLKAWFTVPEQAISKMEIAFVKMSTDGCGNYYMEKLPYTTAVPYYATFYEANGPDNKISVPMDLKPDEYLGIWLKRSIPEPIEATPESLAPEYQVSPTLNPQNPVALPPQISSGPKTCEQYYLDSINGVQELKVEDYILNFEWNYQTIE